MAVVALLLAVMVGAVAASAMSVFRFIALLTSLLVMAILGAIAMSDGTGRPVASAFALFASAQVGYGLGLAALSRSRRRGRSTQGRHSRLRK